ncbi:FKBP8 [Branchiostoma lanceolatum]|uniref:peptidylprolyl isomerase n=1 Tax=Branchiostoma lanceolatum TaxID=7740 RepID=A0A8K0EK64_BRALA|nr:FKBP8 [Branchiostoma lanceolatum]
MDDRTREDVTGENKQPEGLDCTGATNGSMEDRVEDLASTETQQAEKTVNSKIGGYEGSVENAFSMEGSVEDGSRSGKVEDGKGDVPESPELHASSSPDNGGEDASNVEEGEGDIKEEDVKDAEEETDPEWLDILGNGKLKKKVIVKGGDESTRPRPGQDVTIWSRGRLEDGTTVDQHDEITFGLQERDVIQAWDICVSLMGMGETCEVIVDALYAYGSHGREPDIPENATITYELQLLNAQDKPDLFTMSVDDKCTLGDKKRERGNFWYSRNDFMLACHCYEQAVKILESSSKEKSEPDSEIVKQMDDIRLKSYNNMAAAQLKAKNYDTAKKSCEAVLAIHPDNVKGLFRLGKVYAGKGNLDKAISCLRKAINLEPETKIIHNELSKLVKQQTSQKEKERHMYRKMMGDIGNSPNGGGTSTNIWKWGLVLGASAAALCAIGLGFVMARP